jgi:HD-GYP domain-containing protein (c-di-GMP phosphodiesterase class II)
LEGCEAEWRIETSVPSLPSLSRAIEARDPYTRGHSGRVTMYALAVARRLDCTFSQVDAIRLGGPVHDIGKLTIPDDVLLKAGPLDVSEHDVVRAHPEAGARLLRGIDELEHAMVCVLYHHERWDGRGYPLGLAGDEIPLEARILAVADAFDAMTSHRPYRRALAESAAIAELDRCCGSQFDPAVVAAFAAAWRDSELDADTPSGSLRVAAL